MLKQKYSRQKEETDEMEKRRKKLEEQMDEVIIFLEKNYPAYVEAGLVHSMYNYFCCRSV